MSSDTKKHPVWDVYGLYRTAALNKEYYAQKFEHNEKINKFTEILIAVAVPSSGIAAFSLWKTDEGQILWGVIAGIATVVSVVMRISVKKATCFGFKVATHRSVATLVGLGWVSGFFESSFL